MRKLFSLLISSNADLPKDSLLVELQWQETNAVDQTLILRHQKKIAADFTRKRWRGIKSNLFIEKTIVFWKEITR